MSYSKKSFDLLVQNVLLLRNNLQCGYQMQWQTSESPDEGIISLDNPVYEQWLWDGVLSADKILRKYMGGQHEHYLKLDMDDASGIKTASLDELTDWCLYVWRGERFCDGHLGQATEKGIVLAIAQRTIELLEQWDPDHDLRLGASSGPTQ